MPHPLPNRQEGGSAIRVRFFVPEVPFELDRDAKASAEQGRPIYRTVVYVEAAIPGDKNSKIVCPAHEPRWRDKVTNEWITYAQAYSEEYRRFMDGLQDKLNGTPLTELTTLTAAKRAELKALNIQTVEDLAGLDGQGLKRLGFEGNELKAMAVAYMDRAKGSAIDARVAAENAALKAEMQELRDMVAAMSTGKTSPAANDENPAPAGQFDGWSDDDLKVYIKERAGEAPRGRVSHDTLIRMAGELLAKEMEAA